MVLVRRFVSTLYAPVERESRSTSPGLRGKAGRARCPDKHPDGEEQAGEKGRGMKEIRCAEVGFFPDCDGVMRGETEDEAMTEAMRPGKEVHGMTDADFTSEAVEQVRSHIRDV
jgi:predicted small metal-binding protein